VKTSEYLSQEEEVCDEIVMLLMTVEKDVENITWKTGRKGNVMTETAITFTFLVSVSLLLLKEYQGMMRESNVAK
jgi:hypothetical protein